MFVKGWSVRAVALDDEGKLGGIRGQMDQSEKTVSAYLHSVVSVGTIDLSRPFRRLRSSVRIVRSRCRESESLVIRDSSLKMLGAIFVVMHGR